MKENTPINKSVFLEEFDGFDSSGIFMLNKENAMCIWDKYIDKYSKSYFSLPDSNWLVNHERVVIGEWISNFNNRSGNTVEQSLSLILWNDDSIVYFCISRYIVIMSDWKSFKGVWPGFLECCDDCPILINSEKNAEALIFSPIGNIIKV